MRRVDPKHYTTVYYLTDATGFKEFKESWGKVLEPRLSRIVKEIPSVEGLRVLDIGCGRGELVYWAARNGANDVLGIDYSRHAIHLANQARKHYPKNIRKKVRFELRDAKKIDFARGSFDLIIMTEILEHLYPEEQEVILRKISNILSKNGLLFIHTAPSRWFNDFTYRFWCYPLSTALVTVNNFFTGSNYNSLEKYENIRTASHRIMHVNEPDYLSLKNLFEKSGFHGKLRSTNVTVSKPALSWKDTLFNSIVYLNPLSYYPPFNIFWGNDFYSVLKKV